MVHMISINGLFNNFKAHQVIIFIPQSGVHIDRIFQSGLPRMFKLSLSVNEVGYILPSSKEKLDTKSSFMFEKHLEDFQITNWNQTHLAEKYSIYMENDKLVGRQYQTDTGPLDILALSKDGKEFLVVELKRDRVSDEVVGQTLRYMGWVKRNLCTTDQTVRGCIVALKSDVKLENALHTLDSISFIRYEVDFRLIKEY